MKQPNFYQENKLRKRGFRFIAGLDEAGRGAWAGPIVAGAVIIEVDKVNKVDRVNGVLKGVKDSKLLTPKKREKFFEIIIRQVLDWSVGVVSEKVIDEIGIVKANKLAMKKALENLSF
ncbi:MAG: ribonuclease HII, partial [Parcubacteria group bacterium CG23_combo_of_CG06-09_8_20_14_all_35_9]